MSIDNGNPVRVALSMVMVVMLVGSSVLTGVAFSAQPVSAQETVVCETYGPNTWQAVLDGDIAGALSSVYCSAAGLLGSPSEATTSVELEEGAYVQHGQMAETISQMKTDVNERSGPNGEWAIFAFTDAEKQILDARWNDETKPFATGAGRLAANELYATQYGILYEGHNNFWEDAYTWSRATTVDSTAQTIMYVQLEAIGQASGSTMSRVSVQAGENSTIKYENITLPDGSAQEVVTYIEDVEVRSEYSSSPPVSYERVDLRLIDSSGSSNTMAVEYVDANGTVVGTYEANDRIDLVGVDPNGGSESIYLADGQSDTYWLAHELDVLDNERVGVLSDVETRVDEVYTEIGAGEVDPSTYFGPRMFIGEYGSTMDRNVASQLYFHQTIGYETAPEMIQVINTSGQEYEGGLIVGSAQDAPLVYDATPVVLGDGTGDVSLSSHNHTGLLNVSGETAQITFSDASAFGTENVTIDVINVDGETVSRSGADVTASFNVSAMEDTGFVIFEVELTDGSQESGTYVLFADQGEDTLNEVRGFVVGETYSGSTADFLYLTGAGDVDTLRLSQYADFTLSENYDADGNAKAVSVTAEGVDTAFTGTSAKERIQQQQDIRDAVDSRDDIVALGGSGAGDDVANSILSVFGLELPDWAVGFGLAVVVGGVLLIIGLVGFIYVTFAGTGGSVLLRRGGL